MPPTPTFTITEGKVCYKVFARIAPCSSRCLVFFIMNEFEKAAENYTESTKLDDTFVFSHIQLAVALYKMGEVPKSKARFLRTLEAFQDRSEPPNYLSAELPHSYVLEGTF